MPQKASLKTAKSSRKATSAKSRPKKKAARAASPKAASAKRATSRKSPAATLSRDVVEEILVHSARSDEGEWLSDKALLQIAGAAGLDPSRFLEVHQRLCEAEAEATTVVQVVELWGPEEEEEEQREEQE